MARIWKKIKNNYVSLYKIHYKQKVPELGENTGRIHLHGICWGNPDLVKENWKYGFVFQGNMCNEKTVNYVVKYMLKENPIDRHF